MALFLVTVKRSSIINGIRLEKGMSVEVVSSYSNPLSTNGGHEVQEAFLRKYNIDLKKAASLSAGCLDVKKIS